MERNIIFYFSGTGNSLKVTKDIAASIEGCEIAPMSKPHTLDSDYERIGFVFPCYCQGLPNITKRFISSLNLSANKNAYYFAVVTCGAAPGNCLAQVNGILHSKGLALKYGNTVKMFANYVALYKMESNAAERAAESDKATLQISAEILQKKQSQIPGSNFILSLVYRAMAGTYAKKSKGFQVSDTCNGCKSCVNVCPVGNISVQNNKPVFAEKCEQCMACIQWCPKQAINYKTKTQTGGRYHHPDINYQDMANR
jgi:ferredoxin/flavodoxin